MRLVVVAGGGRDRRPAGVIFGAGGAHGVPKAAELGERLWPHADGFVEDATKVTHADTELDSDGVDVGPREPLDGGEHESCARRLRVGSRQAFGDGAFEDFGGFERVARSGKAIAEARRLVAPERLDLDDAAREGGSGHAQHRLCSPQVQARRHRALPAPQKLAMHLLSSAHGVNVQTAARGRTEANDEMNLGMRQRDAASVALDLVDEQPRHGGQGRHTRRDRGDARSRARVHGKSVVARATCRKLPFDDVRFFQSVTSAPDYILRMKILVTGATGKVGSRLSKDLAGRGHHVRALVRDASRAADLRRDHIELATGDLLEPQSLVAAVREVDAVVHCAAFFRGATAEQAHAVNDLGTQHLANAARAAAVKRFVFTSTGLVYGPNGGRVAREDDACEPLDGYPKSKLAAERFLLGLDGLDVRIVRLPFVYGDGDPHIEEAIPMMRGFPPAQRMSIAHHADVAQAVALVLAAASPAHRIYNVTDDEAPSLATVFASAGEPPPDGSNAERARAFDAVMDGRRIREELGFKPKFPRLADAIADR